MTDAQVPARVISAREILFSMPHLLFDIQMMSKATFRNRGVPIKQNFGTSFALSQDAARSSTKVMEELTLSDLVRIDRDTSE